MKFIITPKIISLYLCIFTIICFSFSPSTAINNSFPSYNHGSAAENTCSESIDNPSLAAPSLNYDYFRLNQQTALRNAVTQRYENSRNTNLAFMKLIFTAGLFFLHTISRAFCWLYPDLPILYSLKKIRIIHKKDGKIRTACINYAI